MSDELIVCIVILILSVISAVILIVYICALLAITKTEEYQKNQRRRVRDDSSRWREITDKREGRNNKERDGYASMGDAKTMPGASGRMRGLS